MIKNKQVRARAEVIFKEAQLLEKKIRNDKRFRHLYPVWLMFLETVKADLNEPK